MLCCQPFASSSLHSCTAETITHTSSRTADHGTRVGGAAAGVWHKWLGWPLCVINHVRSCRSGWQPPKDTGLWEVADRVAGSIQQQMTPAQQEYWQGENGYFSQVRPAQP
jgi:hypothetical protein